jgi:uncharacterized protein DUF664
MPEPPPRTPPSTPRRGRTTPATRSRAPATSARCSTGTSGRPIALRRIVLHMIAEYARHNGHADLLRERIDGATGH